MRRPNSSAWMAWGALGAVAAAFWLVRMHLAQHKTGFSYPWLDLYHYVTPATEFVRAELLAGRLALWNPFQLAGMPMAALAIGGALYPGNLLLLSVLPTEPALAVSTVLHWTIAGGFTWLFARRIGLDSGPAAVAALTFMLSGRILAGTYQHNVLSTQVWLPAFCWAVDGLLRDGRPRWIAALAGAFAMAFFGGFMQGLVYQTQLAMLYGLFGLFWICAPGHRVRASAHATAAGLIALGLVAPLLLPALEFSAIATRALGGMSLAEASVGAVEPGQLLRGLFGMLTGRTAVAQPHRWLVALPALALPLAFCAPLARGTRPYAAFFATAAVLAGLFTLGDATPVFRGYLELPVGNLFRFPNRMDYVYVFCAGIVLACGAQGLSDTLQRRSGTRIAAAVAALLALTIGGELFARSRLDVAHPSVSPLKPLVSLELAETLRSSGDRVFLGETPKAGSSERIFAVPDYEPSIPQAYAEYFGVRSPHWHGQLDPVKDPALVPLLDRMSVRFYGRTGITNVEALRRAVGGSADSSAFPVTRPQATPRVFVAERVSVEPDPQRARRAMLAGGPRDVVLTEHLAGLTPQPDASARLLHHEPQSVELEADCAAPCLVVLTDLHYPGWQAELDGQPATIHRANLIFRAVIAPAGRHRIRFEYRPAAFRAGVLGAAGSLAAMLVFWAAILWRARGAEG